MRKEVLEGLIRDDRFTWAKNKVCRFIVTL